MLYKKKFFTCLLPNYWSESCLVGVHGILRLGNALGGPSRPLPAGIDGDPSQHEIRKNQGSISRLKAFRAGTAADNGGWPRQRCRLLR